MRAFVMLTFIYIGAAGQEHRTHSPYEVPGDGLLQEGDRVELLGTVLDEKRKSLNGCSGIIVHVVSWVSGPVHLDTQRYNVRVRCGGSGKARTFKMTRRHLKLLEIARDDSEVYLVRQESGLEVKNVSWCRINGFTEVRPLLWAGEWWNSLTDSHREGWSKLASSGRYARKQLRTHSDLNGYSVVAGAVMQMDDTDQEWDDEEEFLGAGSARAHYLRKHAMKTEL